MTIQQFFKSKTVAWIIMAIVIAWLVCDVVIGIPWWGYITVFFAFMSAFCNLAAIYLGKISPIAAKKLEKIEVVMAALFVISSVVIIIVSSGNVR